MSLKHQDEWARVALLGAMVMGILLLTAFSTQGAGMVPIHIDLAALLVKVAYGAISVASAALLWLGKKGVDTLGRMDKQLTTMTHELFGPEGNNGMRSEVKESTRRLRAHSRVLAVMADREGIKFKEDDE